MMTSDMMTENPDVSKSNLGANRQIGYLYKGMSPEEKMMVRQEQLSQIAEAKVKNLLKITCTRLYGVLYCRERKKKKSVLNGNLRII